MTTTITMPFNRFRSAYGLGVGEFDLILWTERDGRAHDQHAIDIRVLPDRPDLLARLPQEWRERFLRDAAEAREAA